MSNLVYRTEIINLATTEAAATTTQNTTPVDMQNFDGVLFCGRIKTAGAANYVSAQMATATGGTYTNIVGTKQASVTNWRMDIYKPRERYVRIKTSRGSVALGDVWAIKYAQRINSSSTQAFEFFLSPASGTV
jgi:DNA-binding transcriptional regulator LsrR (DeoR family)